MPVAPLLEVCVDSADGLLAAAEGGADRVELCASLLEGGLTPGPGTLRLACEQRLLPVMAMARPRGGDFCYTVLEFEALLRDVEAAKAAGAAGVVAGALTPDGRLDAKRLARLVEAAHPLPLTLHRAFDHVPEPVAALEEARQLGIRRILTSGQAATALDGSPLLRRLVEQAGDAVVIVAAGGVRPHNAAALVAATGVREVHFTAGRMVPGAHRADLALNLAASVVPRAGELMVTDPKLVRAVRAALDPSFRRT